jgi:TPR repeat protein
MSCSKEASSDDMMCCANCGIAAIDDVKLKDCDGGCDLVKYCNDACHDNHREQHEEECRKRLAEIRDKDLFTQPDESHYGECPICCLPMSLDTSKSLIAPCCSQLICKGCDYANQMREIEAGLEQRCAFCREPVPTSQEECDKRRMNRIKKNCPVAMREMGRQCIDEGNYESVLKYWTKAAGLGDAEAHFNLSCLYLNGEGVEKDMEKYTYHSEEAAIGGHHRARHNLGCIEAENGRFERARKHFIIAANLGLHESLKCLRELYADGHASKEDYAGALRAYQAAVEATKSPEREEVESL